MDGRLGFFWLWGGDLDDGSGGVVFGARGGGLAGGFEGVDGGLGGLFGADFGGEVLGVGGEGGGVEGLDGFDEALGVQLVAGDGLGDAEAFDAHGVVGLVVGEGDDDHGAAGAEGLGRGSYAALVDVQVGAGHELRVGGVVDDAELAGVPGPILFGVEAGDEQDATAFGFVDGFSGFFEETAGVQDGGGAEGEDDGGLAVIQKFLEGRGQGGGVGGGPWL
ncbi:hypothetical protein WDZ92_22730, partial [Nostoc sp. NIES-2111]